MATVSTHISYHSSGATNIDYTGKSGIEHVHNYPNGTKVDRLESADGTKYFRDKDGDWKDKNGNTPSQNSRKK